MTDPASNVRQRPTKASWVGLLIGLVIGLMVVLQILAVFVGVIFIALVAAGLLHQPYVRLTEWFRDHRRLAALAICVALVLALMVPLSFTAIEVSREALDFYEISTSQLSERSLLDAIDANRGALDGVNRLLAPLGAYFTPEDVVDRIAAAGAGLGGFFYKQGVSLATGLARFVIGFLVWVIVLYYLLVDGPAVRAWFRDTIPLPADEQELLRHRFMDMASSLVIGNGAAAIIQGVAGGLVFAMLDLPGPVLWGVVMGVLAFIPVVGISLVFIPVWAVLMLAGQTGRAFALLIPLAILATVVEYWLKPVLVGRRAQLHTLLVFFSLVGGFDAFGPVGLLIGPLMMTAFLTLVSIYRKNYRPFLVPSTGETTLDKGPCADEDRETRKNTPKSTKKHGETPDWREWRRGASPSGGGRGFVEAAALGFRFDGVTQGFVTQPSFAVLCLSSWISVVPCSSFRHPVP